MIDGLCGGSAIGPLFNLELTPEMLSCAEVIVVDWLGENQDRFADGGFGCVPDLLARLSPIFEKAAMSASVTLSKD